MEYNQSNSNQKFSDIVSGTGKLPAQNQTGGLNKNNKNMETKKLNKVYDDFNNTIWNLDEKSFDDFLNDNSIIDRHNLKEEIFSLGYTLLMESGFNWSDMGIIATGQDEGCQTYSIVKDENGKLVLCREEAFWGESFNKLIAKVVRQLDSQSVANIEDIVNSCTNGNWTQAKEQIQEALEGGLNVLAALHTEEDNLGIDGKTNRWITLQICKYLAQTPSLAARNNVLSWD